MITIQVKKQLLTARGPMRLDVDVQIPDHELITLFGPSGSGKTSILRMAAGLSTPDEGHIAVNGEVWFDSKKSINKPVQQRSIGFVFQEQNLFRHMTVEENLRYALKDKSDQSQIAGLLEMVDLSALKNQKPRELSGGQRQRVALIRAFLRKPKIFLLDEPLASLDMPLRLKLQDDILALHRKFEVPAIFVTHDLSEIFKLSHKILFLEQGKITKSGKPGEIFGGSLSGKFKFTGTILELKKEDFLYIVTIQIGQNLTKVAAAEDEIAGMNVGDQVIVAAKAFNPVIMKM